LETYSIVSLSRPCTDSVSGLYLQLGEFWLFRCLCHKDCFKIELNPQYIKWRSYYGLFSKEMQLTVGPMEHLFEHLRKVCQGGQLTDNMLLHVLVFSK
jgi:hypothetical protein